MKKEENNNSENSNKIKSGISLIVLVITIIVIIILAAAVIITLTNNNPISEANKARYESDRDNMQSIFTNTVAKVMAQKQGSIKIKAGNLNTVTNGASSAVGQAEYTIENSANSSDTSGKIIFDNKSNTSTDYYTGKQLPLYKAGETIWSVDEEGVLKLSVGGNDYNDNTGGGSSTGGDGGSGVSKEEYDALKTTIDEMKAAQTEMKKNQDSMKNNQDAIKKEQENFKTTLAQIANKTNVGEVRAGQVNMGVVPASSNKEIKVTFKKAMPNTNYSVVVCHSNGVAYWAQTPCHAYKKTTDGFYVHVTNTVNVATDSFTFDYVAVQYTE